MGGLFGSGGGVSGGGDFTTQQGLTGGPGGGGVVFAPQFPGTLSPEVNQVLNSSGSGPTTGAQGTIGQGFPGIPGGAGEANFPGIPAGAGSIIPNNPGAPGTSDPSFLQSLSGAGTQGSNFSVGQSVIDPAQAPFLDFLRSQATQLASQQQPAIGEFAFPFAQELLSGGADLLTQLGSGSFADPLRDFELGPGLIEDQITALGEDINTQLQRQIGGAGGIGSQFNLGGTRGGGRQGVQEGIANEAALNAFSRESAGLRGADAALRNQLGLDRATSLSQLLGGGAESALSGLQPLFNLGISPFEAQFGPLQALSQIVGDPQTLFEDFAQGTTAASGGGIDLGGAAQLGEFIKGFF